MQESDASVSVLSGIDGIDDEVGCGFEKSSSESKKLSSSLTTMTIPLVSV